MNIDDVTLKKEPPDKLLHLAALFIWAVNFRWFCPELKFGLNIESPYGTVFL